MYTVYFNDGSSYKGGSLDNLRWKDLPNKLISHILFDIAKKKIIFQGFEAYNIICIRARAINSPLSIYSELILMGQFKNKVYKITFDFINKEARQSKSSLGKEYNSGRTTGWKTGEARNKPSIKLGKES